MKVASYEIAASPPVKRNTAQSEAKDLSVRGLYTRGILGPASTDIPKINYW